MQLAALQEMDAPPAPTTCHSCFRRTNGAPSKLVPGIKWVLKINSLTCGRGPCRWLARKQGDSSTMASCGYFSGLVGSMSPGRRPPLRKASSRCGGVSERGQPCRLYTFLEYKTQKGLGGPPWRVPSPNSSGQDPGPLLPAARAFRLFCEDGTKLEDCLLPVLLGLGFHSYLRVPVERAGTVCVWCDGGGMIPLLCLLWAGTNVGAKTQASRGAFLSPDLALGLTPALLCCYGSRLMRPESCCV